MIIIKTSDIIIHAVLSFIFAIISVGIILAISAVLDKKKYKKSIKKERN
jgi:VIT1/CCC1 family predicted Fe2+/Mn2+ transporter